MPSPAPFPPAIASFPTPTPAASSSTFTPSAGFVSGLPSFNDGAPIVSSDRADQDFTKKQSDLISISIKTLEKQLDKTEKGSQERKEIEEAIAAAKRLLEVYRQNTNRE